MFTKMKRLPTEIKKQRGTLRADRTNPNEPTSPLKIPPVPTWLSEDGQKSFIELSQLLHNMSVLTEADELSLTLLCDAYGDYKQAKDVINRLGPVQEVTSREAIANQAFTRVFQLLKEFGLTPSSRAKVNAIEQQANSPDIKIENFFSND
jgi:P27 family predicted phage terminase small subunit